MSHQDIWQAVERLAAQNGLSVSGLAKKAGLDSTTFNKSKRILADGRLRWPSTESIMQILSATHTGWDSFAALMGEHGGSFVPPSHNVLEQHLPFIHLHEAHKKGLFIGDGKIHPKTEEMNFPGMSLENSFMVEINNDNYLPLYRNGDKLLVTLNAAMRRGDRVFILPHEGEALIAEFLRNTSKKVDLVKLKTGEDFSLTLENIAQMGRVMWISQ